MPIFKYVGVQHKPESQKIYWFQVPENLSKSVNWGDMVKCDTKKGIQTGKVVHLIDGFNEEEAQRYIQGARFPLKQIVAVLTMMDVDDIYIPPKVTRHSPTVQEIMDEVTYYQEEGCFRNLRFAPDGTLLAGYADYLVAKIYQVDSVNGEITDQYDTAEILW